VYLLALIILIITGLVSIADILIDLQNMGDGIGLFVKTSRALFFLSLLFFVTRMGTKKKD
jgi:hypothetical protein